MHLRVRLPVFLLFILFTLDTALAREKQTEPQLHWYKGNLHTHSFWSDGDDFPEMIADWYKSRGYNFLAFSDHNSIQQGKKWVGLNDETETRRLALQKYLKRFGTNWVEAQTMDGKTSARLKSFNEFSPLFNEPGKFLCIQAEEISDSFQGPLHLGAINATELIRPQGGTSIVDVLQNDVNAIYELREKTGQPMIAHINHPNFHWAITAEEIMQIKRDRFFEVYNGHPTVHNGGDAIHPTTDRMWDIILTRRLTELNLDVVYGIATDDGHHYHVFQPRKTNPGRGWIVVRAATLTPEKLIEAMETGDFYASTGVKLKDIQRDAKTYAIQIDGERGVTYTTQFIGTRKGFDAASSPALDKTGRVQHVTRNYSKDVGMVLAEVKGTSAAYNLRGDEIYVRAKIVSTKIKANVVANETFFTAGKKQKDSGEGKAEEQEKGNVAVGVAPAVEYEMAWTQPFVVR